MSTIKRIFGIMAVGTLLAGCSSDAPESPVREKTLEPNAEMREFVAAQNEAAFSMFAQLYSQAETKGKADHLAYSPLSFSTVFSLVANGAEGETLSQMMEGLNCRNMSLESVNGFCAEMTHNFSRIDPDVKVAFANSVWTDKSLSVATAFREAVEKYYDSVILSIDFSSLEAPRAINGWISDHTYGCIPQYYNPDQKLDVETAIINTLYFKAPWTNKFDKADTKTGAFYDLTGRSQMIPMMSSECGIEYAETDEAMVAALGMGGEEDSPTFTFSIIMPKDSKNFKSMIADLDNSGFQSLRRQMAKRYMIIKMPRFNVESAFELKDVLKNKGVVLPFDDNNAHFNILDGKPWYINGISQKVVFSVNEEGATGTAVTIEGGITMTDITGIIEFNHPFVYVVTENATGAILFMGVITSL